MCCCTTVDPLAWNPFNHIHSQHRRWHLRQPRQSTSLSSSLPLPPDEQTHTLSFTFPFMNFVRCLERILSIFLLLLLHGHSKKKKKKNWRNVFEKWHCGWGKGSFLSLVSLRVFCYSSGQGSQASKGGNLMQITLKGFITLKPATFCSPSREEWAREH